MGFLTICHSKILPMGLQMRKPCHFDTSHVHFDHFMELNKCIYPESVKNLTNHERVTICYYFK